MVKLDLDPFRIEPSHVPEPLWAAILGLLGCIAMAVSFVGIMWAAIGG